MGNITYNGWSNHETWLVNIWIDNEQSLQEYLIEAAQQIVDSSAPTEHLTGKEQALIHIAYFLEEWLIELVDARSPELGLCNDLLHSSIHSVNLTELAQSLLDQTTSSPQ